jgi:hypothetical protein
MILAHMAPVAIRRHAATGQRLQPRPHRSNLRHLRRYAHQISQLPRVWLTPPARGHWQPMGLARAADTERTAACRCADPPPSHLFTSTPAGIGVQVSTHHPPRSIVAPEAMVGQSWCCPLSRLIRPEGLSQLRYSRSRRGSGVTTSTFRLFGSRRAALLRPLSAAPAAEVLWTRSRSRRRRRSMTNNALPPLAA